MPGSSPRVWGIRRKTQADRGHGRFIPTRVGNTDSRIISLASLAVHPHACGEYCRFQGGNPCACGSSPRVWGIRHAGMIPGGAGRFIPTRVGNTLSGICGEIAATVHPHACGEYDKNNATHDSCSGSSPRVWGIQAPPFGQRGRERFIPTRVGNTCFSFLVLPGFPWVTPVRNWPGRGLDRHRRSRWLS